MNRRLATTALAVCFAAGCGAASLAARQTAPDTQSNPGGRAITAQTADGARSDPADRRLMQKIRQSILSDKSLSTYAHNVKIIAHDGKVTLRGPVRSEDERRAVIQRATDVAGADNVTDQLTVKAPKKSN